MIGEKEWREGVRKERGKLVQKVCLFLGVWSGSYGGIWLVWGEKREVRSEKWVSALRVRYLEGSCKLWIVILSWKGTQSGQEVQWLRAQIGVFHLCGCGAITSPPIILLRFQLHFFFSNHGTRTTPMPHLFVSIFVSHKSLAKLQKLWKIVSKGVLVSRIGIGWVRHLKSDS